MGALVSPPLLIADLGLPSRFLNMLRVFKRRSAMSLGAWTLMAFSSAIGLVVIGREDRCGTRTRFLLVLEWAAEIFAALSGLTLVTRRFFWL